MEPIVLIHGYSAESDGTTPANITDIYGSFPADLRASFPAAAIVEIDVSRYVSLEDGVTIDDISRALDRALRQDHPQLLAGGFNVIVHSTGALVIRNWVRRFSPRPSPVKRIIYLAGANLGSGWAHIGKGQLAKWGRLVFQAGTERGVHVLDALELGSSWTLDLHLHFQRPGSYMRVDYGIYEFVAIGTQADVLWFEAPIRYAGEDGSDGVVRVSSSNVNIRYLHLVASDAAKALSWKDASAQVEQHRLRTGQRDPWYELQPLQAQGQAAPAEVPLAVVYGCAHSGDEMGVVTGSGPRAQVMKLVRAALDTIDDAGWQAAGQLYADETVQTYKNALQFQAPSWWQKWVTEPRAQYDAHAQVIFRIRDQDGRPVENFDIFFDSESMPTSELPIRALFEDKHANDVTPNVIAFYLRVEAFDAAKQAWESLLKKVHGAYLEVSATEPETDQIAYLPLRHELTEEEIEQWIKPHTSTIVDIELLRLPSERIFVLVPAVAKP